MLLACFKSRHIGEGPVITGFWAFERYFDDSSMGRNSKTPRKDLSMFGSLDDLVVAELRHRAISFRRSGRAGDIKPHNWEWISKTS